MVTVLHALDEVDLWSQQDHIRYWHGTVKPEHLEGDDDHPVVCWCGGRRYDISDDVCVVWHIGSIYPKYLEELTSGEEP